MSTKVATVKKAPATDAAPQNLLDLMALMIWKVRHSLPALVIQITPADRQALQDTLTYNEQTVKLNIEDRNGTTLIHLTDSKTGDQIIATENNEADLDKAQAAANLRQQRQTVIELAPAVLNSARSGDMSLSLIEDLCNAAVAVARAQ